MLSQYSDVHQYTFISFYILRYLKLTLLRSDPTFRGLSSDFFLTPFTSDLKRQCDTECKYWSIAIRKSLDTTSLKKVQLASEQQGVGATAETGMLNKKALRNFEFPSGLDAEARESLEWLRGGNSPPSAIRNELKTIKLELEKKAEAPVSGKQLALFF